LGEFAWYKANSDGTTHEIGQKKPNPWGLYDILGNVNEWTMGHYEANAYTQRGAKADNPINLSEELYPKVIRGGSYDDKPEEMTSSKRASSTPE
uniref:formylglycine-generating enzyme family protein n=1 Tax=uncultured Cyclobacterium sp. TaxID=453820 RepID=UPI0030EB4176